MGDGFVSLYKRHVPFVMTQDVQPIEYDTIKIQPKGDLVSYVYLTRTDLATGKMIPWDWSSILDFSWYIGNKLIDKQDLNFVRYINPALMSRAHSKTNFDTVRSMFLPLAFSFCHELPFPIVALNYDTMYIKLTLGQTYDTSLYGYQCHVTYIHLDKPERDYFAYNKHVIPITQVQQIFNNSDVMLRNPVKFIATPPVKISNTNKLAVKVNQKYYKEPYYYTGAELYHHTNYSTMEEPSSDHYPPEKLIGPTTFLSTAYGRGFYGVSTTSNSFYTVPWGASEQGSSTYWESAKFTQVVTEFKSGASSNAQNSWMAFSDANTFWKSDSWYGSPNVYIVSASSNVANAWSPLWSSDGYLYGNNIGKNFTVNASSNTQGSNLAFDGVVDTYWTSNSAYFSDFVGTYEMNASSNSTTSNVRGAFINDGLAYWESNITYGSYTVPSRGYHSIYPVDAISVISYPITPWLSASNFYASVDGYSLNVNSSSNLFIIRVFDGTGIPWVSNNLSNTYGFSTKYGIYTSNASYDSSNSWKVFDSNNTTQWVSNSVFYSQFESNKTYNVSATSNTTNTWLAFDYDPGTQWISSNIFGNFTAPGVYTLTTSSNATSVESWNMTNSTGWSSNNAYGNFIPANLQFVSNASSNLSIAWSAFSPSNIWIGTQVYGQIGIKGGTYIAANSSSTQDLASNIFGSTSYTWRSNAQYGRLLTPGTYVSTSNIFSNTGLFVSNVEFLTTVDEGFHTASASSNSSFAWMAFNDTYDFDFNVDTYRSFKLPSVVIATQSSPPATQLIDSYSATGSVTIDLGNHYSYQPVGNYSYATNAPGGTLSAIFDSSSSNFWFPSPTTALYSDQTGDALSTPVPSFTLILPTPVTIDDFTVTDQGSVDQTSDFIQGSNDGTNWNPAVPPTVTAYSQYKYNIPKVLRKYHTLSSMGITTTGSINISQTPNTNQGLFNFITGQQFSYVKLGTYTVTGTNGNPYTLFSTSPSPWTGVSSCTYVQVQLTVPDTSISASNFNPSIVPVEPVQTQDAGTDRTFTFKFPTSTADIPGSAPTVSSTTAKYGYFIGPLDVSTSSISKPSNMDYTTIPLSEIDKTGFSFNTGTSSSGSITYRFGGFFNIRYISIGCNENDAKAGRDLEQLNFSFTGITGVQPQPIKDTAYRYQTVPRPAENLPGSLLASTQTTTGTGSQCAFFSTKVLYESGITLSSVSFTSLATSTSTPVGTLYYIVSSTQLSSTQWTNKPAWTLGPTTTITNGSVITFTLPAPVIVNFNQYIHFAIISNDACIPRYSESVSYTPDQVFVPSNSQLTMYYGVSATYDSSTAWATSFNIGNRRGFNVGIGYNYQTQPTLAVDRYWRYTYDLGSTQKINSITLNVSRKFTDSKTYNLFFTVGTDIGGNVSRYIFNNSNMQNADGSVRTLQLYNPSGPNPYLGTESRGGEYYTFTLYNPSSVIPDRRVSLSTWSVGGAPSGSSYLVLSNTDQSNPQSYTGDTIRVVFTTITNTDRLPPSGITLQSLNGIYGYYTNGNYKPYPFVTVSSITYTGSPRLLPDTFTGQSTVVNTANGLAGGPCIDINNPPTLKWETSSGESFRVKAFAIISSAGMYPTQIEYKLKQNGSWNPSYSSATFNNPDPNNTVTFSGGVQTISGMEIRIKSIYGTTNQLNVSELRLYNANDGVITNASGLYLFRNPTIYKFELFKNRQSFLPILPASPTNFTTPNFGATLGGLYYAYSAQNPNGDYIEITFKDDVRLFTAFRMTGTFDTSFVRINYSNDGGINFVPSTPVQCTFSSPDLFTIPASASPPTGTVPSKWRIYFTQAPLNSARITISSLVLLNGSNDIRTGVAQRGGTYTGPQTTTGGEWVEYVFPKPIRASSVKIFPSRAGEPYPDTWIIQAKTTPTTYTDVLRLTNRPINRIVEETITNIQTSNTYRFIVTSTNSPASSNTCKIGNIIFNYATANLIASETPILTSGMNVFAYSNSVNATTIKTATNYWGVRKYTFDRTRWTTSNNLQAFMFEGNVVAPYNITSGQAVLSVYNGTTINAWLDIDSPNYTTTNNLLCHYGQTGNFTINKAYTKGQQFNVRFITYDPPNPPILTISSNAAGSQTLINTSNVFGRWFPGGSYNGFEVSSNLWAQIQLPTNVQASDYIFNANTVSSWQILGATNPSGPFTRIHSGTRTSYGVDLYTISTPGSYSVYRLSVDNCDPGTLYPSARTLVFRDSIGRAIVGNTFGTFATSIPIANYPIGRYASTIFSYPHTLTTAQNTVTITVPSPITIQSMQIDGTFTSYKVSGLSSSTTFSPGYSTVNSLPAAASYTFTFTFTGTTATITRFELMNRTVGLILPTIDKRNSLVLNDSESRGGPYTGSEITNGIRGEWIELNSTTNFSMYGYQMSSNVMPSSWHVIGWNGSTWSNIDSNLNMFQDITTYSNNAIPSNRVGPWSKVRFIFSNSIQSNVSLTTLNVYSSNFTTLIKPGAVTNDLATTTYINTTYSNSGSNFDTNTQTWYARGDDLTKKLQISFQYPVNIKSFSYTSSFTPTGLMYDIFDSTPPSFSSISSTYTNSIKIIKTGYSSDLTLGTTAPYYQSGFMYTYRGGKFRFETSGTSSSAFYLWVNRSSITPAQADLSISSAQPWVELTLAPNQFVPISIYSSGGTRQFTANTSIDRPGPQASAFPNWLFPTANSFANYFGSPSGIKLTATPVDNPVQFSTTLLNVNNINKGPINVFPFTTTTTFTSVQLEITKSDGYRRPIMQNITFYDDNGPLNIPGALGGSYKGSGSGEFVQIRFPTSTAANSYSFGTGSSCVPSEWTLMNSTNESVWNTIDRQILYSANTTYSIQKPSANTFYRLVINKLGPSRDSSAQITNFKLFGSNGLELIPYTINANNYTTPSTNVYIGTSIVGNYNVTSSTGVVNPTGAFSFSSVPTTFANYSLDGEYRATQSTILNRSTVQPGEWVQLEFPSNVLVDSFSFSANPQPKHFTFTSSNDATHWMLSNVSSSSLATQQRFYTNLTKSIPCKYFRFTVSNIAEPTTTLNLNSVVFWQNGKRINSFFGPQRTFGGPGVVGGEFINLTLPNPRILSSFIVNSPTKQFASNVSVFGTGGTLVAQINTYTQNDTAVYYKLPFTNTKHATYKITFNELEYNAVGSNVYINQVQFLDEKSIPIIPTITSTSGSYQIQPIQNIPIGVYTVSNVLPFDDNSQTRWVARGGFDPNTGSNVSVPAPSIDISFPSNVTVIGYTLYNSYMNSWTVSNATSIIDSRTNQNLIDNNFVYFSISSPYTSNYYKFSVTKTIVGSDTCALGGIALFDSIGRITPKISSNQQLVSVSDVRGGKAALAPENINIQLPAKTIANTYTIYADPFPASWNVYSDSNLVHAVSNYHSTNKISSFILSNSYGPISNITFSFSETQATGSSFTESIKYIQMYDYEGSMILPKFTSNIAYDESYKMSSEMYGNYEYTSSSNNDSTINAFDGAEDTYFENLPGYSNTPYMESNGFTMYYANNAVFNCFDFRNYNTATKGTNPSGECVWIGKVFPSVFITSPIQNIRVSRDSQNIVTITKPLGLTLNAASILLDPPTLLPYTTNGISGEWIQIKMPSFIKPVAYRVVANASVQSWILFGSQDGTNWTNIHSVVEANEYTQMITCIVPFMYFRLVITSTSTPRFRISNFELYNNQGRINSYLISSR